MNWFERNLTSPENPQTNGYELQAENTQQPSEEGFQLTEREKKLLEGLFDWQKHSNKTHWILGQPLGLQT